MADEQVIAAVEAARRDLARHEADRNAHGSAGGAGGTSTLEGHNHTGGAAGQQINHDDLINQQGGAAGDRQHLTAAEKANLPTMNFADVLAFAAAHG